MKKIGWVNTLGSKSHVVMTDWGWRPFLGCERDMGIAGRTTAFSEKREMNIARITTAFSEKREGEICPECLSFLRYLAIDHHKDVTGEPSADDVDAGNG
ncbi:MAG: hypothetical protein HQL07_00535 [Nitrospirae bacterium]|nr:hypothetical protein [Magnetococcales bacterium]